MRVGELIKELEEIKNLDLDYIVCDSTWNEVTKEFLNYKIKATRCDNEKYNINGNYGRIYEVLLEF